MYILLFPKVLNTIIAYLHLRGLDDPLSKIQSVPVFGEPQEYSFHTDLEWNEYEGFQKAIKIIKNSTSSLSVLGEYLKATINN